MRSFEGRLLACGALSTIGAERFGSHRSRRWAEIHERSIKRPIKGAIRESSVQNSKNLR